MPQRKLGRPTVDPKPHSLHVRINEEEMKLVEQYCRSSGKTRAEALREGICLLKTRL